LDIAGRRKYQKVLNEFFQFFISDNYIVRTIYSNYGRDKLNLFEVFRDVVRDSEVTDGKIKIKKVDKVEMNPSQVLYLNLYYWAAYYSNFEIVNMFLIDAGISPFI
jgi:hypothetical protein